MSKIEYINVKPGDVIELPERKKPERLNVEKLLEICRRLLEKRSKEYNNYGASDWLDKECRIEMLSHPVYSESDSELIKAQNEAYAAQFKQSVSQWEKRRETNPANLTELALTLMLQKILPDRFLVVNASTCDDRENGVDNLILDRQTGNVVCGIDEVIERSYYEGPSKKAEKIQQKMVKGGFQVKYGARFKDGNLSLESLKNVPAFYLSLNKEDLVKLSGCLESEEITKEEQGLFQSLKDSLLTQVSSYEKLPLSEPLQENIKIFKNFLSSRV